MVCTTCTRDLLLGFSQLCDEKDILLICAMDLALCCFPCVCYQAFAFGKGDDIALAYLKELRQNGTDRRTEMDTLISGGFLQYQIMKEAEMAEVRPAELVT